MYVPVPYAKADGEAQRELQELGIEEAHMKSDELIEDYCFDATDNQTKAVYPKADVDAYIAELKADNRKLKRALWMARGYIMTLLNRDFQRLAYQCNNDDYKKNLLRRRNRYYELSEKCLKKAKEYL